MSRFVTRFHVSRGCNRTLACLSSMSPRSLDGFGKVLSRDETYRSKSGGTLRVMVQLNKAELSRFLGR